MKKKYIIMFTVLCLVILTSCMDSNQQKSKVENFVFTDQDNKPFDSKQLEGEPWIASFMFTSCETVCPPMTSELISLQEHLKEQDIDIQLISFTVDPDVDSPKKIKKFMKQFAADESNWHFLTGYSQELIESFARDNFQTIVQKPVHSNQVIHGTNFFLVDSKGFVVGEYSYTDESYLSELMSDLQ